MYCKPSASSTTKVNSRIHHGWHVSAPVPARFRFDGFSRGENIRAMRQKCSAASKRRVRLAAQRRLDHRKSIQLQLHQFIKLTTQLGWVSLQSDHFLLRTYQQYAHPIFVLHCSCPVASYQYSRSSASSDLLLYHWYLAHISSELSSHTPSQHFKRQSRVSLSST